MYISIGVVNPENVVACVDFDGDLGFSIDSKGRDIHFVVCIRQPSDVRKLHSACEEFFKNEEKKSLEVFGFPEPDYEEPS